MANLDKYNVKNQKMGMSDWIFLAVIIILAAGGYFFFKHQNKKVDSLFDQAQQLTDSGEYRKALDIYRDLSQSIFVSGKKDSMLYYRIESLRENPEKENTVTDAKLFLADSLKESGDIKSALKLYRDLEGNLFLTSEQSGRVESIIDSLSVPDTSSKVENQE
ncbi:MAG: hypothetical protein ACLFQK_02005 [Fibrobacterota bacterium]